jgi:hypothetical protein
VQGMRIISYKKLMVYQKAIAIVIVIAIILAIILFNDGYRKPDWDIEAFKISLQFLLIVVIGGALTLLFSQYQKECENKEAKKEKYRKVLTEVIREYNSAKRIRRLLRAEARFVSNEGEIAIKAEPYRKQMRALINVQLRFEYLKRFVENTDDEKLKSIESYLKKIESYLNKIILEYENNYITFSNNKLRPIEEFPCLEEFLKKGDAGHNIGNNFKKEFKEPGEETMKKLYKILTEL